MAIANDGQFATELKNLINSYGVDTSIEVPDYIIRNYLIDQLNNLREVVSLKEYHENKYIGAHCIIADPLLRDNRKFEAYVSFGNYIEKANTDSFGVPDERIFYYMPYYEFLTEMRDKNPEIGDGFRVFSWELHESI